MTVAAMEALDRLEAWLLETDMDTTEAAVVLADIDVIRSAFPATPSQNDGELMLMCAVRYAQGRMNYIVSDACRWVRDRWPTLSQATRTLVWRDLQQFLELGKACPEVLGMEMDAREWKALGTWIEQQGTLK